MLFWPLAEFRKALWQNFGQHRASERFLEKYDSALWPIFGKQIRAFGRKLENAIRPSGRFVGNL